MKIGIHQKYWLFMLPLLWMQQPLCAENLSTVSRLYEFTLPQQSVDDSETGGQEMAPEEQEYRKEREILNQQSILSGERLALTPELIEIQQSVDALLQQPEDLTPLKYLQQHPEQLQAYIERQFYNGTDLGQQKTYIQLFALILGDEAVQPMIGWSHILKDHPVLLQSIIKGLTYLKPTIKIRQFIDALLDNELQHPDVIRSAIFYYSVWPDDSAMRWVIQFRNDHTPQNTRYLVFYLAALVGDDSILPRIVEMLEQQPPLYQRYYLQLALSHLVSKDHYQQLTSDMILDEVAAESIRRQMQFRHTSISERDELLEPMLSSYFLEERQMAFKHLLETSNSQKLLQLMHGSNALPVYRRAQQAGIDLDKKQAASQVVINTQALLPAPVKEGNQVNWLLAVLATTTLIALFYFLGRRTNTFGGKSV